MHDSLSPYEPYESVTWLAKFDLVSVGLWHIWSQRFCARHDFKARVKIHHRGGEFGKDPDIAFRLGRSVLDLRFERFDTHHRLLDIGAVEREGQVGIAGKETLNVGERSIFQLDGKLLPVVGRDQVDCEPHAFRFWLSIRIPRKSRKN